MIPQRMRLYLDCRGDEANNASARTPSKNPAVSFNSLVVGLHADQLLAAGQRLMDRQSLCSGGISAIITLARVCRKTKERPGSAMGS